LESRPQKRLSPQPEALQHNKKQKGRAATPVDYFDDYGLDSQSDLFSDNAHPPSDDDGSTFQPDPADEIYSDYSSQYNTPNEYIDANLPCVNIQDHFVEHLLQGLFCTEEEHKSGLQDHKTKQDRIGRPHDTECHGLEYLHDLTDPALPFNNHIPNVLSQPLVYRGSVTYGKTKHTAIKNAPDLTQKIQDYPADKYQEMFEGVAGPSGTPPTICLHHHDPTLRALPPNVSVDFDSVCGFPDSMAVFKNGVQWWPYASRSVGIRGVVHGIYLPIWVDDKEVLVPVNEVPYTPFGGVSTWNFVKIFLLMPSIWRKRRGTRDHTTFLTRSQLQVLYDKILYPAARKVFPAKQHKEFPRTFKQAENAALASANESGRQRSEASPIVQNLFHTLQPRFLRAFWAEVQEIISREPNSDFLDMQIFFNGKGMKNSTSSATYTELSDKWLATWNTNIDKRFISPDEYWWDLGRQFAPGHDLENPMSLMWRKCCLKCYHRQRTKRYGQSSLVPVTQYPVAGLRDSCSISITPTRNSQEYNQGSRYTQFYSKSRNEVIDGAVEVLQSRDIDILAYGSDQTRAIAHAGGATTAPLEGAAGNWVSGKVRASGKLDDFGQTEGSVREEHRLSGLLCGRVLSRLRESEVVIVSPEPEVDPEEHDAQVVNREPDVKASTATAFQEKMSARRAALITSPGAGLDSLVFHLPFYFVPSAVFCGFLRGSLNKNCLGFEKHLRMIGAQNPPRAVTASALLFLTNARFSFLQKTIQREAVLYKDQWKPAPKRQPSLLEDQGSGAADSSTDSGDDLICEGLNQRHYLREFGYAWWAPKIDWDTWTLKDDVAGRFFTDLPEFAQRFKRRANQVSQVDLASDLAGLALGWLRRHSGNPDRLHEILEFCTGLVMIQFRLDVWAQLANTGSLRGTPEEVALCLAGRVPLTHASVSRHQNTGPVELTSSNAKFHKGDPQHLLEYLFGLTTPYVTPDKTPRQKKRNNWENKPYRLLYKQIHEALGEVLSPKKRGAWTRDLYRVVVATNPLLPIADGTTFIQRKHNSGAYCWAAYDFRSIGPLGAPASTRQIVDTTFSQPTGNTVFAEFRTIDRFFRGAPPKLQWEADFLGRSARKVEKNMAERFTRL
jgi:hypothetical protein